MGILIERSRRSGKIPTSSMADIAFLLLIFFLVTTVFDQEKGLSLLLPPPDVQVPVTPDNILHLGVLGDGTVDVRRGASPQVQRARTDEIAGIWRGEVARNPELIAAVKTAPDATYGAMIDVLDQLQIAGAQRVNLGMLTAETAAPR